MKIKISILTLFISANLLFAQSNPKTLVESFDNGQIKSLITLIDTLKHGHHLVFDQYGRFELQEYFIFGKLDGKRIVFSSGRVATIENYSDGALHGLVQKYYPNTVLSSEEAYKNGLKHGDSKWFYQNGKLYSVYNYLEGRIQNPVKIFHENGKLMKVYNLKDNNMDGDFVEYFDDGISVCLKGQYRNGKREGIWQYFTKEGKIEKTQKYQGGKVKK